MVDPVLVLGVTAPWAATAVATWQVLVARKQLKGDLKRTQEALSLLRNVVETQEHQIEQLARSTQVWQAIQGQKLQLDQPKQNLQVAKTIGGVLKFFWEEGFFEQ